jgi:hypothetical protein
MDLSDASEKIPSDTTGDRSGVTGKDRNKTADKIALYYKSLDKGKGKGKGHPITGHEGPEGE